MRLQRSELRENFYRPFWGCKKQSPTCLDGLIRCFPSESPIGPLTRPSGLSREQQLVIFNTLKVFFLPSFASTHGGVSLDRALPLISTSHFWSTLLVRVKAQKCFYNSGPNFADKIKGARSGDNYSISLRNKAKFGRLSVRGTVEAENASNVQNLFKNGDAEQMWNGISGRVEIVHNFDIYKLLMSFAVKERLQTQSSSLFIPALLSTEVVSNNLNSPFHFRIGLHQILDLFPSSTDVVHDCNNGVYFQGGFGVDGVATLLKAGRRRKKKEDKLDQMREAKLSDMPFGLSGFDRGFGRGRGKSDRLFPTAEEVLIKLQKRKTQLDKTSQSMSAATKEVKAGKLRGIDDYLEKRLRGRGRSMDSKFFLPSPHLKVGALAGVVATYGFHKDGLERASLSDSAYASPALRRKANLRWRSSADDNTAKAFFGFNLSAQIGKMRRRILSFTSVMAQCECAVPIPIGPTSLPRRVQTIAHTSRRNIMIGSIPLKPLMNFSFAQQVFGPVRVKADYRVALESSYNLGNVQDENPVNVFLKQLQTIHPVIVDTQFGFDFVVPGSQGVVKFGGWYSPSKKEAMAELRMF